MTMRKGEEEEHNWSVNTAKAKLGGDVVLMSQEIQGVIRRQVTK